MANGYYETYRSIPFTFAGSRHAAQLKEDQTSVINLWLGFNIDSKGPIVAKDPMVTMAIGVITMFIAHGDGWWWFIRMVESGVNLSVTCGWAKADNGYWWMLDVTMLIVATVTVCLFCFISNSGWWIRIDGWLWIDGDASSNG